MESQIFIKKPALAGFFMFNNIQMNTMLKLS